MTSQRPAKCPPVSVIICTLNEAQNLPHVLPRIPDWVDEIILVDGHSTDDTIAVAEKIMPNIKIITQPDRGKGDALKFGITQAQGDIIVTLDADGSLNPDEMIRFIVPLIDDYDFVKGSRFIKGGGTADMELHRKFGNWVFTTLTNILFMTRYTDLAYGYNALRKDAIKSIQLNSTGFEVETEMHIKIKKHKLRVLEIPSVEEMRITGTSNLHSLKDGWRILTTILKERFIR